MKQEWIISVERTSAQKSTKRVERVCENRRKSYAPWLYWEFGRNEYWTGIATMFEKSIL